MDVDDATRRLLLVLKNLAKAYGVPPFDNSQEQCLRKLLRTTFQSLPPREISHEEFDAAMCGKGGAP
jgi:hypothetical protein